MGVKGAFHKGGMLNRGGYLTFEDAMTRKTYTIELKCEFDDPTRHIAVLKLLRRSARQIFTSAMLLNDKPRAKPQIALYSDNFFQGTETLSISDPEDEAPDGV